MSNGSHNNAEAKLDTIIDLLQHLLAIELSARGVPKQEIGKKLHVATATVVKMLQGVKRD
jgi:predicted transcriptional regulator